MKRRHWKKIGWVFVLAAGLLQLPRVVLANHGDEGEEVSSGAGLVFDLQGCGMTP